MKAIEESSRRDVSPPVGVAVEDASPGITNQRKSVFESTAQSGLTASLGRFLLRRYKVWLARAALLAAFLAFWEWSVASGRVDQFFVSRPGKVADFLVDYLSDGAVWEHGSITAQETILGFAIGATLGIVGGVLLARFAFFEDVVTPFLSALNALPRVALAPMFILWFGIGMKAKVYLAVSIVFFVVLLSCLAGIRSVDEELKVTARTLNANQWQIYAKVILPGAVPSIFAGLRLGLVYALLGAVFGEMLAGSRGLGQQISLYANTFNPAGVFGVLVVLACFSLLLDKIMLRIQRRLSRWQDTDIR